MSEEASRLVHDVGKYVARTARNLTESTKLSPAIVGMLARDLYETHAGERASVIVARSSLTNGAITRARTLLVEIDTLEPQVRRGDAAAVRRAAALACTVEDTLRTLLDPGGLA